MKTDPAKDLDVLIDTALRSEPMRPVPQGFHSRVHRQVRIVALRQAEQRDFARRVGAVSGGLAMAAAVLASYAVFFGGASRLASSMPGGLGFFDYLSGVVSIFWSPFAKSAHTVVWMLIGFGAMCAGLFWALPGTSGRGANTR